MDIYRFFHPHHNPRLHRTALRQQEFGELEQAASELQKALLRAQQRTTRRPVGVILPDHFTDIIKAMRFVEASLQTLQDAHPGDTNEDLQELVRERSGFSGWENWVTLLSEQLANDRLRGEPQKVLRAEGEITTSVRNDKNSISNEIAAQVSASEAPLNAANSAPQFLPPRTGTEG